MEKKEYISGDLYKMTRNNAEFKPQEVLYPAAAAPQTTQDNTVSKAQQRRLSDVYNAKLDLSARMERSLQKLKMFNDELELLIEKRKKAADFLSEKIDLLAKLEEPESGRELHEYLRAVEHLRMEYFRKEAEIEPLLDADNHSAKRTSFLEELTNTSNGHIFKLSFCGSLPLLITILLSAGIIASAIIFAMKL